MGINQFARSLGEGNGTGAGVAWPLFGLICGVLGLTIGGFTAIILGTVSCGLFVLVCVPTIYFACVDYLDETKEFQNKMDEIDNILIKDLYRYLLTLSKICIVKRNNLISAETLVSDIKAEISKYIEISKKSNTDLSTQLLCSLQNTDIVNKFVSELDTNNLTVENIEHFRKSTLIDDKSTGFSEICKKQQEIKNTVKENDHFVPAPLTQYVKVKNGFRGFTAGFGSIAGGSAGALGLLSAIGVIPALSFIPIVGWALLGAAVIFGCVMVGVAIYCEYKKNERNQLLEHYNGVNKTLNELKESAHNDCENMLILQNKPQEQNKLSQEPPEKIIQIQQNKPQEQNKLSKEPPAKKIPNNALPHEKKIKRTYSQSTNKKLLRKKYSLWCEQHPPLRDPIQQNIAPSLPKMKV